MAANHGLRTTGRPTGNFGRNKVQGKRESLDLNSAILNRENLRIPDPNESYNKLVIAYNTTTDAKLKAALWDMLKRRKATLQQVKVKPQEKPDTTHWDQIKLYR
jgi:hypothetical protein